LIDLLRSQALGEELNREWTQIDANSWKDMEFFIVKAMKRWSGGAVKRWSVHCSQ
jgi:murein tripeptide amidase MpaA